MMHRNHFASFWLLAIAALTGCGEKLPDFGQVDGTVKIKGKPKSGILVRFLPDPAKGNELPINASGVTDDAGRYVLKYVFKSGEGDGAPVGWHRVVIEDTRFSSIPQGAPLPPRVIPVDYGSPSATPWSFEVKAGAQTIDLDVP